MTPHHASDAAATAVRLAAPASPRRRVPRPLLLLAVGFVAALVLAGMALQHIAARRPVVRDGGGLSTAAAGLPYAAVFQSAPGQPMVPVATRKADDLRRWLQLQRPDDAKSDAANDVGGQKSDYPETVHLYSSGRIVLVAPGTSAQVVAEQGAWRQVRILGGEHNGMTGYAPRDTVLRSGLAASGVPKPTLTIP